jgi:hypothetical protein
MRGNQKPKTKNQKFWVSLIIVGGFFVCFNIAQAATLGEQVNFYVDASYDAMKRSQLPATLKVIGENVYFYVENYYWNELDSVKRYKLIDTLEDLADEFDNVIYPKERAVFGSEWNPGIDNDKRITVLVTQLVSRAGGYFNAYDEYPRSKFDNSNEREMIYLNALNILSPKNKAFLAHEFQHLISHYQKVVLYGIEEEVWLNEARSEYAPTLCGYDDVYQDSYLADRVDVFLDNPEDSLTEWRNKTDDYGVASLFLHYLVDHYGKNILTRMTLNDKVGIESINAALASLGYTETFSDIFADWAVSNYLNDCQVPPGNRYCYLDDNLTYARLHVDYSASYSGFPNLIVSRSSSIKDWSPHWYRFRQGTVVPTDRDTLKLEFVGQTSRADFRVPYIVTDQSGQTTVQFINLEKQKGVAYIPDFTSLNKIIVMIPINQYKKKGFGSSEPSAVFSFTASSVKAAPPVIEVLTPSSGSTDGGYQIVIKGENLSDAQQITFGQVKITNFEIVDEGTIVFTAPAHSAGLVDIIVEMENGEEATLANAFTYLTGGPIGSLSDGSLVRAVGDYKVYIIKGNYKRWIQDAEIFNHYGHLKWEDIIEVSPEELEQYQDAWLIRAANDFRVYEVNGDGTKHWLNMTAEEFTASGRLWGMVYIVNSFERDFYPTGADVMFQ